MTSPIEILAPAGAPDVLDRALQEGTDACYLGLKSFSARRFARNFTPDELQRAVEKAHAQNAKIYLTLNTDLTQRELTQALQILALAQALNVDAVLVRDPALLGCAHHFPRLKFYASTQCALTTPAGMRFAKRANLKRVVLPRELSFDEIKACVDAEKEVQCEVFAQGALCFSISGKCLLSSFLGGRSGNRGTCASPCRFGYLTPGEKEKCFPFSMHDLNAARHVGKLAEIGVASLKIEGRLKQADWVGHAVKTYVQAREGIIPDAQALTAYSGRAQTDGYLRGDLNDLTGLDSGRSALESPEKISSTPCESEVSEKIPLKITVEQKPDNALMFTIVCGERTLQQRIPARPHVNQNRAITLETQCADMLKSLPDTLCGELEMNADPAFKLMPTQFNALDKAYAALLRLCAKPKEATLHFPLEDAVKQELATHFDPKVNPIRMGSNVGVIRLTAAQAPAFAERFSKPMLKISVFSFAEAAALKNIRKKTLVLPWSFFPSQLPEIEKIIALCKEQNVPVEVNNFDALELCLEQQCRFETGPGLGVLNARAARYFQDLGAERIYVSLEIGKDQLECLSEKAQTPLSVCVYAHIPLLTSRVPLCACANRFKDTRAGTLCAVRQGALSVYYSEQPMNWTDIKNERVSAAQFEADFTRTSDTQSAYLTLGRYDKSQSRFNYERGLK